MSVGQVVFEQKTWYQQVSFLLTLKASVFGIINELYLRFQPNAE
jgi:hypothetical protein